MCLILKESCNMLFDFYGRSTVVSANDM